MGDMVVVSRVVLAVVVVGVVAGVVAGLTDCRNCLSRASTSALLVVCWAGGGAVGGDLSSTSSSSRGRGVEVVVSRDWRMVLISARTVPCGSLGLARGVEVRMSKDRGVDGENEVLYKSGFFSRAAAIFKDSVVTFGFGGVKRSFNFCNALPFLPLSTDTLGSNEIALFFLLRILCFSVVLDGKCWKEGILDSEDTTGTAATGVKVFFASAGDGAELSTGFPGTAGRAGKVTLFCLCSLFMMSSIDGTFLLFSVLTTFWRLGRRPPFFCLKLSMMVSIVGRFLFLTLLMKVSMTGDLLLGEEEEAMVLKPGTEMGPPIGFCLFISSTNFLKLKFLKSGAGVPSIPTGSGFFSTSDPAPLLARPMLPKNEAGLRVVVVVVASALSLSLILCRSRRCLSRRELKSLSLMWNKDDTSSLSCTVSRSLSLLFASSLSSTLLGGSCKEEHFLSVF